MWIVTKSKFLKKIANDAEIVIEAEAYCRQHCISFKWLAK